MVTMKNKTQSQVPDMQAIDKTLAALCQRLSAAASKKPGEIHLTFTDAGELRCLDGSGGQFRVTRAAGPRAPLLRISGSSPVLSAIMRGEKEASRAFIAGGLQVSGDLEYLEALLEELELLNCK
jgi:hypothetical protein